MNMQICYSSSNVLSSVSGVCLIATQKSTLDMLTYTVKVFVDAVVGVGVSAVAVVPPVAHEHLLVEDGSLRAQKAVLAPVEVAVMVGLQEDRQYHTPLHLKGHSR